MATKKTSQKAPAKKAPAKKTAKKKAAGKAPAGKASAKKRPAANRSPRKTSAPHGKTSQKKASSVAVSNGGHLSGKIAKSKHFKIKDLREQLNRLLLLRERVSGEISSISRDSLSQTERDPSLSDQGTDTFDREFALNQLSSEQDVLFEIDEAIRRLENGSYGICEMSGEPISLERLQALPYVRYSITAQAEIEKGRHTYRPFGSTIRG
jgi:RNA polymerase-binding transcription factor DksA